MALSDVINNLPEFKGEEIIKSFVKGYSIINNPRYKNIMCSISGGADSDIMLDLIYRIDENKKVTYVWFNTGVEYQATKDHLEYLENRYNIKIRRERAIKPIPVCTREYGQPFLSKYVSDHIHRLQKVGFKWEDEPFEVLIEKYPKVKGSLNWWCNNNKLFFKNRNPNENEGSSRFDINVNLYLKEFLIAHPPNFNISSSCCDWTKKKVSKRLIKETECDLIILGVRKAEGGIRATAYKNCYSHDGDTIDQYRPLFWFKKEDKEEYDRQFGIVHSDCYEKWGFSRTGCVGCPYGRHVLDELNIVKRYEPKLYKAANNIFKESYEYTKQYRQFVKEMKEKESKYRRTKLW